MCLEVTLMNCGLARRTVATKHTRSSKAGCRDRWIKPSRVQSGTGVRGHTSTSEQVPDEGMLFWLWKHLMMSLEGPTSIKGLEVSSEPHIVVHRRLLRGPRPAEHVATELQLISGWGGKLITLIIHSISFLLQLATKNVLSISIRSQNLDIFPIWWWYFPW